MKVYNFDDTMWIAAGNEVEAKNFAKEKFRWDDLEAEEAFQGEASLDEKTLVEVNELSEEEINTTQKMTKIGSSIIVKRSFEWVIEKENITEPCVIASTEW